MAGDPHPADEFIVDGVDVSKSDFRSFVRVRQALVMADAAEVNNTDLSGQQLIQLKSNGRVYILDTGDTTTPDNGVTFLRDANNLGFDLLVIEGLDGVDGATIYSGSGAPSSSPDFGSTGDYYLNTDNGDLYKKIDSPAGAWSGPIMNLQGSDGINGASALTIVRVVDATGLTPLADYQVGDTVDGVTLQQNDLVLRAAQSDSPDKNRELNGVYVVPALTSPATAPSRHSSFDTYDEHPGSYFSVMEGTTYADSLWRCTSDRGGVLNTTAIVMDESDASVSSLPAAQITFAQSPALGNSSGTNVDHIIRDFDGDLSNSLTKGIHEVWVPASAMKPNGVNGAAVTTFNSKSSPDYEINLPALAFDQISQEYAQFSFAPPKSWNESTFTVIFYFTAPAGQASPAQSAAWTIAGRAIRNNETIDGVFGAADISIDFVTGANTLEAIESDPIAPHNVIGSPDAVLEDSMVVCEISRDVGSDDVAGDLLLLGVKLRITISEQNDA